ncbi:hypothetical protein AAMO2058_001190200 [Amorphochlora amoebiformis]
MSSYMRHALLVTILRDTSNIIPDVGGGEELPDVLDLLSLLRADEFDEKYEKKINSAGLGGGERERFVKAYNQIHNARTKLILGIRSAYREARPIHSFPKLLSELNQSSQDDKKLKHRYSENNVRHIIPMYWQLAFQHLVYTLVVQDKVANDFPAALKYRKEFIDSIVTAVEDLNCEVHEGLLDAQNKLFQRVSPGHISFGKRPNSEHDFTALIYRTYDVKDNRIVTLRTATTFSSIGCWVWDASRTLSELILGSPSLFRNRRILELGSGAGLTACILAQSIKADILICTDYQNTALLNLQHNLNLNKKRTPFKTENIVVSNLDWLDFKPETITRWYL